MLGLHVIETFENQIKFFLINQSIKSRVIRLAHPPLKRPLSFLFNPKYGCFENFQTKSTDK